MGMPKPTAERLLRLASLLEQTKTNDKPISSAEIERLTGWPSHTVRKDISMLGAAPDISTTAGYDPEKLAKTIRNTLGIAGETQNCCIVGLGRLGSALLDYPGFINSPFTICAGFDSNVNRIDILKADFPLYPTYKMKEVIPRLAIRYAVLAVPAEQAQATAYKLVEYGITGIVNFTQAILSVPQGIEIEQVSIIDALGNLAARNAAKRSEK